MPRPSRAQFEGALYYLIVRANHRQLLFRDDHDCARYLELLRRYRGEFGCCVYAYVLTTRKAEVVLETPKGNIGRIMQCVGTSYAAYYNRRYKRRGTLFEGRYRSYLLDWDNDLLEATRRIHRSASCGDAKVNRKHPWNSYGIYLGRTRSDLIEAGAVLSRFGEAPREQRTGYRKFVDGEGMGRVELLERLSAASAEPAFKGTATEGKNNDPSLAKVKDVVRAAHVRLGLSGMSDRPAPNFADTTIGPLVRYLAMYLIRRETTLPLHSIGELFGVEASAVAMAIKKLEELVGEEV